MEIVRSLAGYSYGRSDLVRRAMAKKKHDVMAKEREFFIHGTEGVEGSVKRGVPEKVADHIFDEMMDFASYAFNKSHAACYAVLAYRTAYLKLYYPVEFMTALINSFMGSSDNVANYVYTAKRLGLTVLPPDVNKSSTRFSVERLPENPGNRYPYAIRFGLAAVKSVGSGVMDHLVQNRNEKGPFTSFFNFCDRAEGLNKRMLEALILCGCFDSMNLKRSQLLAIYEKVFDSSVQKRKAQSSGQMSLFDFGDSGSSEEILTVEIPDLPEMKNDVLLAREREVTGMYLSGHPLDNFTEALSKFTVSVEDLMNADGLGGIKDDTVVTVGGMLSSCKQRPAKSGNGMIGYSVLEGVTGSVETVIFSRALQQYGHLFSDDSPVIVRGRLNIRDDRVNSLLIEELKPLSSLQQTVYIRFAKLDTDTMRHITEVLKQFPGSTPVILFDSSSKAQKRVPETMYISVSDYSRSSLENCFGQENVKIK